MGKRWGWMGEGGRSWRDDEGEMRRMVKKEGGNSFIVKDLFAKMKYLIFIENKFCNVFENLPLITYQTFCTNLEQILTKNTSIHALLFICRHSLAYSFIHPPLPLNIPHSSIHPSITHR